MTSIIKRYFFIFMVGVYGCKKDEKSGGSTSVHGFVISEDDGCKISGANVWLVKSGGSSALSDKTILYKKSNVDGYYNFDFEAEENSNYFLATEAAHYYKKDDFYFTKGKNNKLDLPLIPKGYIRVNFINEPPKESTSISVNIIQNLPTTLLNDTFIIGEGVGNKNLQITWWIRSQRLSSTVYIKALDTVYFTIKY